MSKIPADTEKKISDSFRKRLNELISEQGCSKNEFANLVQVSLPVITRAAIYGIIPSLRPLIKIADYFKISLPYLLGENDDEIFYPSEEHETFHTRLEQLAKEKNVKYAKIAHSMPFTKTFFYEWQRAKTLPSLEYLEAIADYFNVSIDYLLGRTDERD